jgi:hypothetical protein
MSDLKELLSMLKKANKQVEYDDDLPGDLTKVSIRSPNAVVTFLFNKNEDLKDIKINEQFSVCRTSTFR